MYILEFKLMWPGLTTNAFTHYDGLNENVPHGLMRLNTWSSVGRVGDEVALLEKACHCWWVVRFQKTPAFPVCLSLPHG